LVKIGTNPGFQGNSPALGPFGAGTNHFRADCAPRGGDETRPPTHRYRPGLAGPGPGGWRAAFFNVFFFRINLFGGKYQPPGAKGEPEKGTWDLGPWGTHQAGNKFGDSNLGTCFAFPGEIWEIRGRAGPFPRPIKVAFPGGWQEERFPAGDTHGPVFWTRFGGDGVPNLEAMVCSRTDPRKLLNGEKPGDRLRMPNGVFFQSGRPGPSLGWPSIGQGQIPWPGQKSPGL